MGIKEVNARKKAKKAAQSSGAKTYADAGGVVRDTATGKVIGNSSSGSGATAVAEPIVQPKSEPTVISSTMGQDFIEQAKQRLNQLMPPPVAPTPTPTKETTSAPTKTDLTKPEAPIGTVTFINPDTEQTQKISGNSLTQDAVDSLKSKGYQIMESDGDVPDWVNVDDPTLRKANNELTKQKKELDSMTKQLSDFMMTDKELAGQIASITGQWNARKADMERINERRTQSIRTLGVRLGSRYTGGEGGMFGGIITEEERQGVARIGELEAQKQAAISAAREAQRTLNWQIFSKQVDLAEKAYSRKLTEVENLNKLAAEESKKVREQLRQSSIDGAISDLMNQGITDPMQVLNYLNYSEDGKQIGDVTMKEVTTFMKSLQDLERDEPGIIGEWQAALRTGAIAPDATLDDFLNIKDPGRGLELRYKRLQIEKLQQEIDDGGIDGDADELYAYAQQYATTGQIPTGMPKGSFGIVSKVAKEIPKAKGTVVNSITGVTDSKAPATEQQDYARLYNIVNNINRLKALDNKRMGGVIGGTLGAIFGENDQAAYMATRKAIVDDMQRMQSGAALTPEEIEFYEDYLPGRFSDTPGFSNILFEDSGTKINEFEKIINNRLEERLSTNNLSIYGYSKVDVGGRQYTVGDIIVNGAGQAGRVNPDGSITLIDEE